MRFALITYLDGIITKLIINDIIDQDPSKLIINDIIDQDPSIATGLPLIDLIDSIKPGCINYEIVCSPDTEEVSV